MTHSDVRVARQTLEALWPELPVQDIRSLGEGWMSRAFMVNDELVFRFAKHADGSADTHKEVRLLPKLLVGYEVAIPRFSFVGSQPESGFCVVGYRALPGQPLEQLGVDVLDARALVSLAGQLGPFLDALQRFPIDMADQLGVPTLDLRRRMTDARAELHAQRGQLADDVHAHADQRLAAYLDDEAYFAFEPALLHADLSPDHLLVDPHDHRLTGVIDFGDVCLGDPDYEYLYMAADIGLTFAQDVMRARGVEPDPQRMRKLSLLQTFDHVQSILGGLRYGRRDLIEQGILDLTAEARGGPRP